MLGEEKHLKTKMLTVLTKLCVAIWSQLPVKGTSKRGKALKVTSKGITLHLICSSPTTVLNSQNGSDLLY